MGNHAHFERMLVVAWASTGIALTVQTGVARIVGIALLGLLALLLARGRFDTWKHERELRTGAQHRVGDSSAKQDDDP